MRPFRPPAPNLRFHILWGLLLLVCFTTRVEAQAQTTLRGTIVDAMTGQPVSTVDLRAADAAGNVRAATVSNPRGEFTLQLGEGGIFTLTIRHVAYVPVVSEPLEVTTGDHVEVAIRLDPGVVVLDAITVIAGRGYEPIRITEFRERAELSRRMGRGRILMREDLERLRPVSAQDILDSYIWSNRCQPTVLLDGLPTEGRINWVAGEDVEGVEIYRGVTQIPPEYYRYGMCGLVLVWQRPEPPGFRPWTWRRAIVAGAILVFMGVLIR
jgi:hypothetical protein